MEPYCPRMKLATYCTTPNQSEIGRSVGLVISTLCGEILILVISVRVCSRVVGVVICTFGLIMILGCDPTVPIWRLLYVQSPANERPAIR